MILRFSPAPANTAPHPALALLITCMITLSIALTLLPQALAATTAKAPQPQAAPPVNLAEYGRAYLAEGDAAAAAKSYGELVRQNPFDPVMLNNMAVAKAAGGDYHSALELFTRAVRLAPQRADIRDNQRRLQQWLDGNNQVKLSVQALPAPAPIINTLLPEPPPLWQHSAKSAHAAGAADAAADKATQQTMQQPIQQAAPQPTQQADEQATRKRKHTRRHKAAPPDSTVSP